MDSTPEELRYLQTYRGRSGQKLASRVIDTSKEELHDAIMNETAQLGVQLIIDNGDEIMPRGKKWNCSGGYTLACLHLCVLLRGALGICA